jgi:hypothetical protein
MKEGNADDRVIVKYSDGDVRIHESIEDTGNHLEYWYANECSAYRTNGDRLKIRVVEKLNHGLPFSSKIKIVFVEEPPVADNASTELRDHILYFLSSCRIHIDKSTPLSGLVTLLDKKELNSLERQRQAIDVIRRFLDGSGAEYEWDDFTSVPYKSDPIMEDIRTRCLNVQEQFPTNESQGYCNEAGEEALRAIIREIEGRIDKKD